MREPGGETEHDMWMGLALATVIGQSSTTLVYGAPAGSEYAKVVPGGRTILPNGRILTPTGKRLYTGGDLWHVALSPDGKTAVGVHDGGITVYRNPGADAQKQTVARKDVAPAAIFSPDGKFVYLSTGDEGGVEILDATTMESVGKFSANDPVKNESYLNDLAISPDGKYLYGADIAHQDVVTFNLASRAVVSRVGAGREPYALTVGTGGKLFVANIGIFDYSLVGAPRAGEGNPRGISTPAFGFPSKEAMHGVEKEGRKIKGLGDPRVPEAQSIWAYDLRQPEKPAVIQKVKSGILIHGPADQGKAVGASAPNELIRSGNRLYVSNANNDTVQMFDATTMRSLASIKLTGGEGLAKVRGVIPSGMAINRAGNRLYVCESGLNSVAIIDTNARKMIGRIPTGWFPMQVQLSPDEKHLVIATQKGLGRGPRGALHRRPEGDERSGLGDMPGMIDYVTLPFDDKLKSLSNQVLSNNGLLPRRDRVTKNPIPNRIGQKSAQIEYVVFITKENHTFDGIFGELKSRGARAEPEYAEFGSKGWIEEKGKAERLPIMPNHIKLANEFAISDNFYMEPQASGDGHRWLVGVYPSLWTTRVFYAGWNFKFSEKAPGRLVSFGSDGSQIPEDYLENGSMWEHLGRNGITFRNYGEGYELPNTDEGWMTNRAGTYYQVNHPMPKILFDNSDFDFPAYNTNIPDIARADWFKEDIEEYRTKNKGKLPRFINIAICNDHGAGANAARGYPYVCSYMADNDLALGRIVEYLTKQPEWKKMAIFVTQDDSGGDDDSVDRHRSFVLAISPFTKRGHISKEHSSIMSIIKSIYSIFGCGPNNMFDAVATSLSDMFTETPNYAGYKHVPVDPRVFKPEATFDPFDPKFEKRRRERPQVKMDDPRFVDGLRKQGGRIDD
jgi:YVTN family beta-propeller protein